MRRDEIVARLKAAEPEVRARGAVALYLFGSVARDEARETATSTSSSTRITSG